jgi:hypothetical protein
MSHQAWPQNLISTCPFVHFGGLYEKQLCSSIALDLVRGRKNVSNKEEFDINPAFVGLRIQQGK